ncbi:uncharacterized protein LOC123682631 [Harmonia axyridis]|uniref:uncharacterized protein LOC123682631 n=1 Tax=Harmonia axyridis TaxID=115357 RepID=UPI001E27872D|nr:uncharacterized protein LOC123682631 [Harmonia axyridis]XP_045477325.1 uncharacterized protein LOC123682631 [Harmonia axyridis]XP_045477326.1 uncharacterized protein LOC123682631 [Harmonia axyridis]
MDKVNEKEGPSTSPNVPTSEEEQILIQPGEQDASPGLTTEEMLLRSSDKEGVKGLEKLVVERHRLSGAARKRMKFLIKKGMAPDEARKEALKPIGPRQTIGHGTKRKRSEYSTPKGKEPERAKHKASKASQSSGASKAPAQIVSTYSQVAAGLKVGIMDKKYPEVILEMDQLKAIEEAILEEIMALGKEESIKPKFQQSLMEPGWLCLTCSDKATVEWLRSIQPKLKPWEGADLRIAEEAELPHPEILVGYLPESQNLSSEKILKLVENQNEGLKTSSWRVLRRGSSGPMVEVTISADRMSVERLRALNWRINYRFGQSSLRLKGSETSGPVSEKPKVEEMGKVGKPPGIEKAEA